MSDAKKAADLRARAATIRDQGRKLQARARSMPDGSMRDLLEGQAAVLIEGAEKIDADALALDPAVGTA
ncbi:MAG: hypothetical protein ACHP7N_10425 [Caulobacterales bacterium]